MTMTKYVCVIKSEVKGLYIYENYDLGDHKFVIVTCLVHVMRSSAP